MLTFLAKEAVQEKREKKYFMKDMRSNTSWISAFSKYNRETATRYLMVGHVTVSASKDYVEIAPETM